MVLNEKMNELTELEKNILAVALDEFEKKSFHGTNVDDIADQLGIGKGTIYRHFGNKIMLFGYVFCFLFNNIKSEIADLDDTLSFVPALDNYILLVRKFVLKWGGFFHFAQTGEVMQKLKTEMEKNHGSRPLFQYMFSTRKEGFDYLKKIIKKGQEEGVISQDYNPLILAEVVQMVIFNYLHFNENQSDIEQEFGMKPNFTKDEGVDELKKFVYRGLGLKIE